MYKTQTKIIWDARTKRLFFGVMLNVENVWNQKLFTVQRVVRKKLVGSVIVVINCGDICR